MKTNFAIRTNKVLVKTSSQTYLVINSSYYILYFLLSTSEKLKKANSTLTSVESILRCYINTILEKLFRDSSIQYISLNFIILIDIL